jgi:hypothetical protein
MSGSAWTLAPLFLGVYNHLTTKDGVAHFRHTILVLYCAAMMSKRDSVRDLARLLKRGGLGSIFAAVLEAGGPLRVLGAQAAFLFDPLFGGGEGALARFGEILEDPEAFRDLISVLREEG